MTGSHLVAREVIELRVRNETGTLELSDAVAHLHSQALTRIIERCFDHACTSGGLVRLDRLEVDLGVVAAADFAETLPQLLGERLPQALAKAIAGVPAPEHSDLTLLASFVEHGVVLGGPTSVGRD